MTDLAIQVEHVGKRYRLGTKPKLRTFGETLAGFAKRPLAALAGGGPMDETNSFWALKDVSFEVKRGEAVGIIGRNGAGKSTLLKILSRITEPTEGQVVLDGRVGSLLEVGTGFHPELTGRENIYLNGAILGMTRQEIAGKFDEIVDFSEVEKFLDTPVKQYSSGMYTRLAFAVAANLEPEILIVDEVLAVGDAGFQKKCLGKMQDVASEGRTVLFVSHNMAAVRTLCQRCVMLDGGRVLADDLAAEVIEQYLFSGETEAGVWVRPAGEDKDGGEGKDGQKPVRFLRVEVAGLNGEAAASLHSSRPFGISVEFEVARPLSNAQVAVRVTNGEGVAVFTTANTDARESFVPLRPGRHTYRIVVPGKLLAPGRYSLLVAAMVPREVLYDLVENRVHFHVENLGTHATLLRDERMGVVTPLLHWEEVEDETFARA